MMTLPTRSGERPRTARSSSTAPHLHPARCSCHPRLTAEFAHVHPEGSLHLALSTADQNTLVATGWGERHPLYSPTINVVMLYGPRTDDELAVAKTVEPA